MEIIKKVPGMNQCTLLHCRQSQLNLSTKQHLLMRQNIAAPPILSDLLESENNRIPM